MMRLVTGEDVFTFNFNGPDDLTWVPLPRKAKHGREPAHLNELVIWWIEQDGNEFFGQGTIWHQLSTAIWFAFSTLFSRHGGELHRTRSRVIGVIWLTFTLVLISTYSANLTAIL
ncbi:hypothetical protein AAC387_Pa11g2105 [Persea americana]